MEAIGLYQLNNLVKRELKNRFPDSFLVIAESSPKNVPFSLFTIFNAN